MFVLLFLSVCIFIPTLSLLQANCTAFRALNFGDWVHQHIPTGTQAFFSFLPEITLAVMITYLIGVVAVELASNRAPKILALEC
jgi:hypothetical protein